MSPTEVRDMPIKLLLLDCDGVLTDGRLYFSAGGEELKVFDVQDGLGIVSWIREGNMVGIISGRESEIVDQRAEELGIQIVRQRVNNKVETAREIWAETGIKPQETAFIGDDIPDIELIREAEVGIAVANAVEEVKAAADQITSKEGGRGAVREAIDLLMRRNATRD
jgi:3-deoxy-D-manno-octulosonate 8-phosphate phosphatase (KDO 8-P phosphatase)